MSDIDRNLMISKHDEVCTITLHRPEKKNALTSEMYEALESNLVQAGQDPAVRVVLINASGDAFTAGNDLADFVSNPPCDHNAPVLRFLNALADLEKPVVAAVGGMAVGVGVTMLLHCDLVYAADEANFKTPFVPLGLVPEAASSLLFPAIAGYARASEILLLGEPFNAATAHEIGLVTAVVPRAKLDDHVQGRIKRLVALPAASLRATKALIRGAHKELVKDTMRREAAVFLERLGSPEAAEALQAFAEKRRPDFSKFS